MTKSATFPAASVPRRPCSPSARAALRVTPASASSAVSPNRRVAMLMASSSEVPGAEPGLQSVATAMRRPRSPQSLRSGGLRGRREAVEGNGQQHSDGASRRRARAHPRQSRTPGGRTTERADAGRHLRCPRGWRAARHASSRASPSRCAASNSRSDCARLNPIVSQNTSTASTSPSRVQRRQPLLADRIDVVISSTLEFRRQRMSGEQVVCTVTGNARSSARATRSILPSSARVSP